MLRKVITLFVLCFFVCLGIAYYIAHYRAGLSLNMEMFQIVILGTLVLTNASYLCIILYKIEPLLTLAIMPLCSFFDLTYMQRYKDVDSRLKLLYLLAGLLMTTIIIHLIQRKKSSPH